MEQASQQADVFEDIFDRADIGVAVLDANGTVVRSNGALARFMRRAPSEIEGRSLFECVPNSSRRVSRSVFESMVSEDRDSDRVDVPFIRSDGHTVHGLVTFAALTDGTRVGRVVAIIDDITAEKEALRLEREREQAVRRAYADVVSSITGGRLLIVMQDELPDQLGERILGPLEFHDDSDPGDIRHAVREFAREQEPELAWDDGFEVAVGEAMINALKHAGGGELSLHVYQNVLQAVITDEGPGIDFSTIAQATFDVSYEAAHALGVGFTLILSFTSRILLATGREGTTIVLEGHNDGPDKTLPS